MRYVLDCSVAIRWFVPQSYWQVARSILADLRRNEVRFIAPRVIIPEFGHVMRKLAVGKIIEEAEARDSLLRFLDLPIELMEDKPLSTQALDLSLANMATFYDALYVALAMREDLKVLTADKPMTTAFAKLDRTVWLGDLKTS